MTDSGNFNSCVDYKTDDVRAVSQGAMHVSFSFSLPSEDVFKGIKKLNPLPSRLAVVFHC